MYRQPRLRRLCFRVYSVNSAALSINTLILQPPILKAEALKDPFRQEAICLVQNLKSPRHKLHRVVHAFCQCGIHGLPSIRDAFDYNREHLTPSHNGKVVAATAHWGRMIQGDFSLRSQYAQVMGIFEPCIDLRLKAPTNPFRTTNWSAGMVAKLKSAASGRLPILDVLDPWEDPAWVREWAKRRNLAPQADIVTESKLFDRLEAM